MSSQMISHAANPETRLVVGIVVDQLRTDYLRQLSPLFGDGGFNRLMKEGVFINDVDFKNTAKDPQSGTAVIYTGAWPAFNGVSSAEVYDETQKRALPTLSSSRSYSPEKLRISTLSDELALAGGGDARIYSIGADPQVSVIMTGHDGTAPVWLDENTGKWTSSSYYPYTPQFVAKRNHVAPVSKIMENTAWRPLLPSDRYPLYKGSKSLDFSYSFRNNGRDAYTNFKNSAPFNEEITDFAIDILKEGSLTAQGSPTGMLNIEYTVAPISFDYDGDNRMEMMDSYLRLDQQLSRLFEQLEKSVGLDNTLVMLVSSGNTDEPSLYKDSKVPGGEFSFKKAESLLDSYLSASHGNGDYVIMIRDDKVYLNHKLIEDKKLDLKTIRREAADFLEKMSGIAETFTYDEVKAGTNGRTKDLALTADPKTSADLYVRFSPGWTIINDSAYPTKVYKASYSSPATPAFILSSQFKPVEIIEAVDATAIAPTISSALNIRAPNGAESKPLILEYKKQ